MSIIYKVVVAMLLATFISCRDSKQAQSESQSREENAQAKQMLKGVWVNEDEGSVAFRVEGDTIFYPDTASQPARFAIYDDTLVVMGYNDAYYPIIKQTAHLFVFRNQSGDEIRVVKSNDPADQQVFMPRQTITLNQRQLIKRDTVIVYNGERYHGYIQVNPTTYKVTVPALNSDGVEVDNVYYDNIIHLSIYNGSRRLFSADFHKQDFARHIPAVYLRRGILNDMTYDGITTSGINYTASVGIPNSQTSYLINVLVDFNGKLKLSIKQ